MKPIHLRRKGGNMPICLNSLTVVNVLAGTTDPSKVTCKNCLKIMARGEK